MQAQFFDKVLEVYCGGVTCLPGAFSMIRYSIFKKVAPIYFLGNTVPPTKSFEFHRFHLGEDRYLTQLLLEEAGESYMIGYCPYATCKTDAPNTLRALLKQR